jgi:hypothetical protein
MGTAALPERVRQLHSQVLRAFLISGRAPDRAGLQSFGDLDLDVRTYTQEHDRDPVGERCAQLTRQADLGIGRDEHDPRSDQAVMT